jgi:hypothetical protein
MQNLSVTNFNGTLKMTDLESVIRNVTGVNDVVLLNVSARPDDSIGWSAGVQLISGSKLMLRQWQTVAGYLGGEAYPYDFVNSLNCIPE